MRSERWETLGQPPLAQRPERFTPPRRRGYDIGRDVMRKGIEPSLPIARFSYCSMDLREHHLSLRSLCVILGFSRSSAQPLSSMLRAPACDCRQLNSSFSTISSRHRPCFRLQHCFPRPKAPGAVQNGPSFAHSTSVCVCLPRLVCEMFAVRVCAAPGRRHSRFRLV